MNYYQLSLLQMINNYNFRGKAIYIIIFCKYFMISQLRKVVAGPKHRTVTQEFDLDFTYITDTVVAMAYPASGLQQTYRNSITDVAKYLQKFHTEGYLIINVSNRKYQYKIFKSMVKQYEWEDHQAPTLYTLFQICNDSFQFIKEKNRIVCFHCNHGKGRTGTAIICLFLFLGFFKNVEEGLKFYNKRRFNDDNYGVCQPCQIRCMQYFLCALKEIKSENCRKTLKAYKLWKIEHQGIQGENYDITIYSTRTQKIKHNKLQVKQKITEIQSNTPLMSDVYIEVKMKGWVWDSIAARANINLNYCEDLEDDQIVWVMSGEKVRLNAKHHNNFVIKFYFQQFCKCDIQSDWACPCASDREIEQKEWQKMISLTKATNGIQSRQICKMLYPSQVIEAQQENLEVKTQ